MQVKWRQLLGKTGFWLAAEIWLNLLGLDNLADYSEFVFDQDLELFKKNHLIVKVSNYPPNFCIKVDEFCPIPILIPKDVELKKKHEQSPVLKHKCKKLNNPCMKVLVLPNS